MDLNEVSIFIQVVQEGSFSQAARKLGMPNSTVSAKVSSLEKRLGVTLIQRTTRRLSVTPAGQAYFKKCIQGLQEIQSAEAEIAAIQGEPQGLLRVTAPVELGMSVLPQIVSDFTKKYPKVSVEVLLADRRVELLAENVDIAIRAGELKDSTLVSKKLGVVYFAVFASPKYLKTRKAPSHPRDLKDHECLHFTPLGSEEWKLSSAKGSLHVPVKGRVIVNDLHMIRNLAVAGDGLALLPTFFCQQEQGAGKLVRVLKDWKSNPNPVQFVYPAQKYVTPKLSAFIQMATEPIRASLSGN